MKIAKHDMAHIVLNCKTIGIVAIITNYDEKNINLLLLPSIIIIIFMRFQAFLLSNSTVPYSPYMSRELQQGKVTLKRGLLIVVTIATDNL